MYDDEYYVVEFMMMNIMVISIMMMNMMMNITMMSSSDRCKGNAAGRGLIESCDLGRETPGETSTVLWSQHGAQSFKSKSVGEIPSGKQT